MNLDNEHYNWLLSAFDRAGFFRPGRALHETQVRYHPPLDENDVWERPKIDKEAYERDLKAALAHDEQDQRDRLERGEKMFVLIHGSG